MCRRCRKWLMRQSAFVPLVFVSLHSPDLAHRFPGIGAFKPQEQLLVIADNGAVYRGASAWIMCLWALQHFRQLALRFADPILMPLARVACELLSENRFLISRLIFRQDSHTLARDLAAHVAPLSAQACESCRYQ